MATVIMLDPKPEQPTKGGNPSSDTLAQNGPIINEFWKPDKHRPSKPPRPPPDTPENNDTVDGTVELQRKPHPYAPGPPSNPPPDILALEKDGDKHGKVKPKPAPGSGPTKPHPEPEPIEAVDDKGTGKPKGDPIPQGPVGPGKPEVEAVTVQGVEIVVSA